MFCFIFQANIEGMLEVNYKRYAIEGHWRKVMQNIGRQYNYAGKFQTPQVTFTFYRFLLNVKKFLPSNS